MPAQSLTFEIVEFSEAKLDELLSQSSSTSLHEVKARPHTVYFHEYFKKLKASTILVERHYVDHDYREDYAGFYSRCFRSYSRDCARLHFFAEKIVASHFEMLLRGDNSKLSKHDLQRPDNYLGFIVIKPIPKTFVGKTCLLTYPEELERRFPITRDYAVNLFGIPLSVNTIAFQEQDLSVSACATSALWAAFQGTGKLFQHSIPTPIAITQIAMTGQPSRNRALPNEGLSLEHMAHAINGIGLEPVWIDARPVNNQQLQGTIYAYTKGRIPVLLIGHINDAKTNKTLGLHAVAVCGFKVCNSAPCLPDQKTGFLVEATRLSKIYAHDDQVGPFAKMEFKSASGLPDWLTTSHSDSSGSQSRMKFATICVLVPVSRSIRLPFSVIRTVVMRFDSTVETARAAIKNHPFIERFSWEIFLISVNEYKSTLLEANDVDPDTKAIALQTPMPLFLWCARLRYGQTRILDLLFDTTDIKQGQLLVKHIEYEPSVCQWLKRISAKINTKLEDSVQSAIWDHLSDA